MFLSRDQLLDALSELDKARPTFRCSKPRTNKQGKPDRLLNKNARTAAIRDVPIPYGIHDADYVVIDPDTGTIQCGACNGHLDATVEDES